MIYEQGKISSRKAKELYDEIYNNASVLYTRDSTYANIMVLLENAVDSKEISKEEYEYLTGVVNKCCIENSMNLDANIQDHRKALEDAKKRWNNKSALWKFFHNKQKPNVRMQQMSVDELNKLYR